MTRINIHGRYVYLTDEKAAEVLQKMQSNEIRSRQISSQLRDARLGPRKGPGSQFAGWVDTKSHPKTMPDTELVYTTDRNLK